MKKNILLVIVIGLLVGFTVLSANATDASTTQYSLRSAYSNLSPVSTDKLGEIFDQAIIVDARNAVEYNVIHVKGAVNILVGKMKKADLLKLRPEKDFRPLVFYCNGTTCPKSYKAAQKANIWGFNNVFVYDAGIFEWANVHPERTLFFGKPLSKETVKTTLISKTEYKKHCLPPKEFLAKVKEGNYTLFDIRDRKERNENQMYLPGTKKLTLDQFVGFLNKGKVIPASNILIFGNVGKQSRWLQYYLQQQGRTNYYFLDGGVKRWVDEGFSPTGTQLSAVKE